MPTRLTILTGSSRGMGAAIAEQLLQPGHAVLGIARQVHPGLADLAAARGATAWQWTRDLGHPGPVADELADWLATIAPDTFAEVTLINNAALLGHIGPVDEDDPTSIVNALRVGLEAPLLLSAAFVRATAAWPGRRRILNISSGLGRRAMAGSAVYCAVKAGLDHLPHICSSRSADVDVRGSTHSQPKSQTPLVRFVVDLLYSFFVQVFNKSKLMEFVYERTWPPRDR